MENEQNRQWCSMTPFVCSVVPIGIAGLVWFFVYAFPRFFRLEGGCFLGTWNLIPCCIGPLIALLTLSMGIYSVLSGSTAIRESEVRGKWLVLVAIILGILEILIGIGYLFYVFWTLLKVFQD
jgi:hypothetical protein